MIFNNNIKAIIITISLLLPLILNAKNIEFVYPDNHHIIIKIENLSDILEIKDNYYHLQSKYSYTINSNNQSYDIIKLSLALPSEFKKQLRILKTKELGDANSNYFNDLRQTLSIDFNSYMRDLPISIIEFNPFIFKNGKLLLIEQAEIYISFDKELKAISDDRNFYSNIINISQVKFDNNNHKSIKKPLLQINNWYNPNLEYIRFSTKGNGIAKILAKDILSLMPNFSDLSLNFFHLYNNGNEIPIKFISADSILNNNDEIYFLSEVVAGDTTWFNNYTDSSIYFFTFDTSKIGLRYQDYYNHSHPYEEIQSFVVNKHLEEEHEYFWGDFNLQWDVENIHREKWLWDDIDANGKDQFKTYFLAYPIDTLNLKINLESMYFNKDLLTKHNFFVILNKDTIDFSSIDTGSIKEIDYKIPKEQIIPGLNELIIKLIPEYDNNNLIIPNKIGIDYIELNYESQTKISYFDTEYIIPKLNEDDWFYVLIDGFKSENAYIIDKEINTFLKEKTFKTLQLSGAISKDYISYNINGNPEFLDGNYFIAINFDSLISIKKFISFEEVYNYLKNFDKNSKFIFLSNLKEDITYDMIELFKNFGANNIRNYNFNSKWFFKTDDIFLKDKEILSDNEAINFDERLNSDYFSGESYTAIVSLNNDHDYHLVFGDDINLVKVDISKVDSTNLRELNHQADALIIVHPNFIKSAERLSQYRKNQGFSVELINVQDIYKEFNYGIKEPKAIKDFIKYAYNNWQKPAPKFILLIGDANWDSRNKLEQSVNIDYIPTYGWPPSDYWYSQLDDTPDDLHDIFIGRLPVHNNEQLEAIIDKIIEYDSIPKQPWMKRFLSLTGGQNSDEIEYFYEDMFTLLYDFWFLNNFAGDTAFVHKQLGDREKEANKIISEIDRGAIWVNFLGHGSPQVFDMDGWHADKLNNKGKYSFFTTISCNTAAFAEPIGNSRDEEYVLIRDKGFIGAGGSTNLGLVTPGLLILGDMLNIMLNSDDKPRFLGEILNNAKIRLMSSDPLTRAFAKQYVLIGDPMIKLRISRQYDLYIQKEDVKILNPSNTELLNVSDSIVHVSGILYNNGFCYDDLITLKLIHQFNEQIDTLEYLIDGICFKEHFNFNPISIFNEAGKHNIKIYIENKDTTFLAFERYFEVFENGLLPVDPLPYWSISPDNITIRMINPNNQKDMKYEFKLSRMVDGKDTIIYKSNQNDISIYPTHIDWKINTTLDENYIYYLHSRVINKNTLQNSRWSIFPFTITNEKLNPVTIDLKGDIFKNLTLINCALDSNDRLQYKSSFLPISVKSSRGIKDTIRLAEIEFNDTLYIITPSESNAPVGINLIVISSETQMVKSVKYYYTWGDENSTKNLVNFLNDSVSNGDWLALASCGSAWRQFYYTGLNDSTKIGSFYTFKTAMSKFGAKEIWNLPDSIDNPYVSYVFVGQKNKNSRIIEKITYDGSLIKVKDSIEFYPHYASINLPDIFGFDSLLNIIIDGLDFANNKVSLILNDVSDTSLVELYQINGDNFNLSHSNLNNSNRITGKLIINREDITQKMNLNNIKILIIPSPELAIDNEVSRLNHTKVIRADTVSAYLKIVNLSLRRNAENLKNIISTKISSGNVFEDSKIINELDKNSSFLDTLKLSTLLFDLTNDVILQINSENAFKELYTFNNNLKFTLEVLKDSIKPTIEIYSDDVLISDSAYISLEPKMKFLLFDNSYEPIEIEAIKVRFNGATLKSENSKYYDYQNINNGHLKSQLEIHLDSVLDYDNLIEVYYLDASGNRDTVEYHLFTTINSFIYDEYSYPNPFTETSTISFMYKSPDNNGVASIQIFDINGKLIRKIQQELIIGENKIMFDGRDQYGNKISSGIYYYFIQIISQNFSRPKYGKILKN